jgi:mercuric ion transport protein
MEKVVRAITLMGDKASSLGALLSAMGCAMCFPAIATLGAAVGLGILSRWEGMFINSLLPAFATAALLLHALGWYAHRQWYRSLAGMIGPALLLLSLYPWFRYGWSSYVTYFALAMMVAVSIADMLIPVSRRCDAQCEPPASGETE